MADSIKPDSEEKHRFKWALTRENLSSVFVSNKGTDQPAHAPSLISPFVIRLLESTISKLASILASLSSEQAVLGMTLSETSKMS